MELQLTVNPNEQSVYFVDQMMESFVKFYELNEAQELCFVLHELIINAVEASIKTAGGKNIEIAVLYENGEIAMTVTDSAGGIPEEQWAVVTDLNVMDLAVSERGRGFLFIQHMVDRLWFENLDGGQFKVGVKKKITTAGERVDEVVD